MEPITIRHKITKRCLIRIIGYISFVILVLMVALILSTVTAAQYRMRLEYSYERGLSELSEHMINIEMALTKGLYTGTAAGATKLAMNLRSEADAAKACLTQIPSFGTDLESTYRFLSQVGEYALSLADTMEQGGTLTQQEHATMVKLSQHATDICRSINLLCNEMNQEGKWKEQIENTLYSSSHSDALSTNLKNLEESLKNYPTLLYDGPFSQHILQPEAMMIKDQPQVSEISARQIAAKAIGNTKQELGIGKLQQNNVLPCYVYTDNSKTIAITQKGGILAYLYDTRAVTSTVLQYDQCLTIAQTYLERMGLGQFTESYYTVAEGICLINFAYLHDDVVCYTDLIKIGVALDNGDVVSYNAQGYIMNHTQRTLAPPQHTLQQAQAVLSPYLTVNDVQLAIIPTDNRTPQLCYEFLCTGDQKDDILVYINAETLEEEELLILLKTDGGTLTL